jgi:hypothetical protein
MKFQARKPFAEPTYIWKNNAIDISRIMYEDMKWICSGCGEFVVAWCLCVW